MEWMISRREIGVCCRRVYKVESYAYVGGG